MDYSVTNPRGILDAVKARLAASDAPLIARAEMAYTHWLAGMLSGDALDRELDDVSQQAMERLHSGSQRLPTLYAESLLACWYYEFLSDPNAKRCIDAADATRPEVQDQLHQFKRWLDENQPVTPGAEVLPAEV